MFFSLSFQILLKQIHHKNQQVVQKTEQNQYLKKFKKAYRKSQKFYTTLQI